MARVEYFKVRVSETCNYCKAELSENAGAMRAQNGEIYGVECHRKADAKTVSHGDHRHKTAAKAARCTAVQAHAELDAEWREKAQ